MPWWRRGEVMPVFERDGAVFNYLDVGAGVPFVFQHGIGGDLGQPLRVFRPPHGVRLLSFDCRAHGDTVSSADPTELSFRTYSDDLIGFLDHLGLARAVVGGISMGAGVALGVAVRYPERVAGLVLSRPAWLAGPMPDRTVALFDRLAGLLRLLGSTAAGGRGLDWAQHALAADRRFSVIATRYPDTARSLRGQLTSPRAVDGVARLERLPRDRPIARLRDAAGIRAPTLVIAHRHDPLHPFAFGAALARTIPGARLARVTARSIDEQRHADEVHDALVEFVQQDLIEAMPVHLVRCSASATIPSGLLR